MATDTDSRPPPPESFSASSHQSTRSAVPERRRRTSAAQIPPAHPPPNLPLPSVPASFNPAPSQPTVDPYAYGQILFPVFDLLEGRPETASLKFSMDSAVDQASVECIVDPLPQAYLSPPTSQCDSSLLERCLSHWRSSRNMLLQALKFACKATKIDATCCDPEAAIRAYSQSAAILRTVFLRSGEKIADLGHPGGIETLHAHEVELRRLKDVHYSYVDRIHVLRLIYSVPSGLTDTLTVELVIRTATVPPTSNGHSSASDEYHTSTDDFDFEKQPSSSTTHRHHGPGFRAQYPGSGKEEQEYNKGDSGFRAQESSATGRAEEPVSQEHLADRCRSSSENVDLGTAQPAMHGGSGGVSASFGAASTGMTVSESTVNSIARDMLIDNRQPHIQFNSPPGSPLSSALSGVAGASFVSLADKAISNYWHHVEGPKSHQVGNSVVTYQSMLGSYSIYGMELYKFQVEMASMTLGLIVVFLHLFRSEASRQ